MHLAFVHDVAAGAENSCAVSASGVSKIIQIWCTCLSPAIALLQVHPSPLMLDCPSMSLQVSNNLAKTKSILAKSDSIFQQTEADIIMQQSMCSMCKAIKRHTLHLSWISPDLCMHSFQSTEISGRSSSNMTMAQTGRGHTCQGSC